MVSCQYTQALSFVTQEQTTHCELSEYPGFVAICDTRTIYSLMSCQYTKALLSSVTQEQTTHWWAVRIPRLCCHLWHENKLLTVELSVCPGCVVICDLNKPLTDELSVYPGFVVICDKYKLLTGELSIYLGFVVICDTRTNYSLVSCQYTQALLSSVTREQTTHWWAVNIPRLCYPATKSEGYSFGAVHLSVHSVRPSVCNHISVPIGQIWFILGTNDKYHGLRYPKSFVKINP